MYRNIWKCIEIYGNYIGNRKIEIRGTVRKLLRDLMKRHIIT